MISSSARIAAARRRRCRRRRRAPASASPSSRRWPRTARCSPPAPSVCAWRKATSKAPRACSVAQWRVAGKVVGGAKRGTGLGFPTANIPLPRGTALGHGIYAVRVHTGGERHDAAAYLGTRPTYDDGMPVLEVFLFDFDGDLYGREIEVEFVDFIRADRKFDSSEALIAQMQADVARARDILAASAGLTVILGHVRERQPRHTAKSHIGTG